MLTLHAHEALVAEWRRRIEADWGSGTHSHTLAMVEGLVLELLEQRREPESVLSDIGRRCANDGHELSDVTGWFALLLQLAPRKIRRGLQNRTCAEALASGWTQAALDQRPAFSRLAPVASLHLRLRELLDQCNALGIDLAEHCALIVLDVDTGPLGPGARRAVVRLVGEAARKAFRAGESIAAADSGRILVLAPRSRELASVVRGLVADVQGRPEVAGHRVRGWIEPLPRDCLHLDGLLEELGG